MPSEYSKKNAMKFVADILQDLEEFNAMELVADILQDLEEFKVEVDERIQQVYLDNDINDKTIQRAVKKAAQAKVKRRTEEVKAEADEVSKFCHDDLS